MQARPAVDRRALRAWALYDWGNSAFSTTVTAGFFPIFFKQYWSAESARAESTFQLGMTNSAAALIVAVLAPLLGAIADRGGAKKRMLLGFALLGALATGSLFFVGKGNWQSAALCYALANIGFFASMIFYDSLLIVVAAPGHSDRASALGYALGYLGGGSLFALQVVTVFKPAWFGFDDAGQAVRAAFLQVALWWIVFTIPLMRHVPEPTASVASAARAVRDGVLQLRATLRRVRGMRQVWMFLLAYWLYIDGVNTLIVMAVDYGLSLGFSATSLTLALLITQFVGFPAALVFGRLGSAIGSKRAILIALGVYVGVTVWGYAMDQQWEFFVLAGMVGLVQGGVQALSRSLYSRLIPPRESAEFFGFYNMLGKFAAIIGPALMGWVSLTTGSARLSILSLSLLLLAGGALLLCVRDAAPEGQQGTDALA
jgi:MFS transporter, UMF1 family